MKIHKFDVFYLLYSRSRSTVKLNGQYMDGRIVYFVEQIVSFLYLYYYRLEKSLSWVLERSLLGKV